MTRCEALRQAFPCLMESRMPLSAPRIDKVILAQNPTVPLSRWVRWKLTPVGTPTSEYGLCFRVFASANAVGAL